MAAFSTEQLPHDFAAESHIERRLREQLAGLKYKVRDDITDRYGIECNFRRHFEALNRCTLTDGEFKRLLRDIVTPDVFAASKTLRAKHSFERDDGTPLNYTLVDLKDWCKNTYELVTQLRINTDNSHHRYDVILLVNGLPLVQIELKRHGTSPKRAIEQIVGYKNDPGNGYASTLLCFMQLFVVSNDTETFYFTNNDAKHFRFNAEERFLPVYRWADRDNKPITGLHKFADTFLPKCVLGRMISRYTVLLETEQKLLMMRPYQIYAVERILDRIEHNSGNGYIWHTTGSGKTLTSFKASTLLRDDDRIAKCLFVVDRKDLDKQTRDEFNRFQPGSVEENTSTATLVKRLLSTDKADKVIVTTIQKLALALNEASKRNKQRINKGKRSYADMLAPMSDERMAIIFDECHRSQFGDNHQTIKEFFPRAQLFGFTGTPIFPKNSTVKRIDGEEKKLRTTADLFGQCLHEYTITNAIEDRNVLRFHVDYFGRSDGARRKSGEANRQAVVDEILDKHDRATGDRRFNALFATGSINEAIAYYDLFNALQAGRRLQDEQFKPLKIACVFSPPGSVSQDVRQLQEDLPQELADYRTNPAEKLAALERIITDYNAAFGTNHATAEFDRYYQDVQSRIKLQQVPDADLPDKGAEKVDLVIVVDMLLTGFDSKYLNTLYVDKNLKHHGLIQAFSRTNRVLNATKPHGQILDFRGQQQRVDEAVTLFSGSTDQEPRTIWLVDPAPKVIDDLKAAKTDLVNFLQSQGIDATPEAVAGLKGDDARAQFVKRFKEVQRLAVQLDQYTDLTPDQKAQVRATLPESEQQGFKGVYLSTRQRLIDQQRQAGLTAKDNEPGQAQAAVNPELDNFDFEMVLFASATIDYDYIKKLISRFTEGGGAVTGTGGRVEMTRRELIGLIESEARFADDRDLLTAYINSLEPGVVLNMDEVDAEIERFKAERAAGALAEVAKKHNVASETLTTFVDEIVRTGSFDPDRLTDLAAAQPGLSYLQRTRWELSLMDAILPILHERANGRQIAGLESYEEEA
ncbi:MAG: type I restriction endonuclease subunit R [Planctomycetota bacterium]